MPSGLNSTEAFNLLQETYPDPVVRTLYNEEAVTLSAFKRFKKNAEHGRWMRGAVKTDRTPSAAAHAMGGVLPGDDNIVGGVARRRDIRARQWTAIASRQSVQIRADGEMLLLARGGAAFTEYGVERIEDAVKEMGKQRNQQLYRTRNGRLATIAAGGVAGSVITLTAPTALANAQEMGTRHMVERMAVRGYDATGQIHRNTTQGSYYVEGVDTGTRSLTLSAAPADFVAGDQIVLGDDRWTSLGEEWDGLPVAGGDVTFATEYLGLSRLALGNRWSGVTIAADDGVNFGELTGEAGAALMARAVAVGRTRVGGMKPRLWFCDTGVERELPWGNQSGSGATGAGFVSTYRNEPGVAEGGADRVKVHLLGVGLVEYRSDVDCTPHTAFGVDTEGVRIYDAIKPQWVPGYAAPGGRGQMWIRDPNTLQYLASFIEMSAFVAEKPPCIIQITGIRSALDN